MTREERMIAVLEDRLPADILSDEEIVDLQERVLTAIASKKNALEAPSALQ